MSRALVPASFLLLLALLGAGLGASCQPDLHSLIGRPCDAEHSCVDEELVCCRGTCQLASEDLSCGEPVPGPGDGGTADGGPGDGGSSDGGMDGGMDGRPDAGAPSDGGASDGGGNPPGPDAGTPDAGLPDAGTPDAGLPDAGCPPNLQPSGSAEPNVDINDHFDGTGRGSISLSSTIVRSGVGAIKMTRTSTSSGTYGVELKEGQLAGLKIGVVYCVSAWFRRGTTRGEIVLTTRHFKSGGFANILSTRVTPPDDGWYRLITPAGLTQEYNLDITFFTAVSTSAGSEYYVDDIRIWESPDLACDPACAP